MANFEGFIGFLEEESKTKAANGVRRSNSNPRSNTSLNDNPISLEDVKNNFNDLYKLKENNLAAEIELNKTALEINKQRQTIAKAAQKETKGLAKEEEELNNKHEGLLTNQATLETFKNLQFSNEKEPLLKDKFLKIRHFKTIETKYQNGELSQNKLRARVEVLDGLRAEVRQLRSHAVKKIDDSKKELEKVNVEIEKLDLKKAVEVELPKESTDQLTDLKNKAVILTEEIKKNEAIVVTIDTAMSDKKVVTIEQPTLEARIIEKQPVDIAKSSKLETVTPEVAKELHTPEKNQPTDVSKISELETATPEVVKELHKPEEKPQHVYAKTSVVEGPDNKTPELRRKVIQPSENIKAKSDPNPVVEPTIKPESKPVREEPDSGTTQVPTDLTQNLKEAVIKNLQATKALSELRISKKQELLDTLKNTKENKPLIENLLKEIKEEKEHLAGIEKTLEDPEKLVDKLKGKIDGSSLQNGLEKMIEDVKENTKEIEKETDRLKNLSLPELKKGFLTPSRGFKWGRRLLHLWPFAMIPLVIAAATMILTPVMFVPYGVPLIAVLSTAIVASYAVPKLINYVRTRRAESKQKQDIQKIRESPEKTQELAQEKQQDVKKEQTQEQTKEKIQNPRSKNTKTNSQSKSARQNSRSETIEQKTASQANSLENQNQEQPKLGKLARVAKFAKKNWKPLAIMVGGSLALGAAGVFLLPLVAPGLAAGVSIAALFTIGSTAMIGAGTSIGAQLLDRFGLKKVENHLKNKENEKIHTQVKDYQKELDQTSPKKDQSIVRSAVVEAIKENTETSKDQPTQAQSSVIRDRESIQTIPVVHNQSQQSSVRNNVIPLNSPHAGQQQEAPVQRRHSFSEVTARAQAKSENANKDNKVQRSQSLRSFSSEDKARTQ